MSETQPQPIQAPKTIVTIESSPDAPSPVPEVKDIIRPEIKNKTITDLFVPQTAEVMNKFLTKYQDEIQAAFIGFGFAAAFPEGNFFLGFLNTLTAYVIGKTGQFMLAQEGKSADLITGIKKTSKFILEAVATSIREKSGAGITEAFEFFASHSPSDTIANNWAKKPSK